MKLRLPFFLLSLSAVFLLATGPALAASANLPLTEDTFVKQDSPDVIYGNGNVLTATGGQNQNNAFILLKFNLSSLPEGSLIDSARLLLTSYSCSGADPNPRLTLRYPGRDWAEDTARWNGRPSISTEIASVFYPFPTTKSFDVTRPVAKWVDGSMDNFGLILEMESGAYSCNFYSRERSADAVNLVVNYTAPDTTKPTISHIQVSNITTAGGTITWNTNEESNSEVDYYTITSGQLPTILQATGRANTTNHSVALKDLTAGKKYYYRVRSKDNVGNEARSSYGNFTTKSLTLYVPSQFNPQIKFQGLATQSAELSASPTPVPEESPTPDQLPEEANVEITPTPSPEIATPAPQETTNASTSSDAITFTPAQLIIAALAGLVLLLTIFTIGLLVRRPKIITREASHNDRPETTPEEKISEHRETE